MKLQKTFLWFSKLHREQKKQRLFSVMVAIRQTQFFFDFIKVERVIAFFKKEYILTHKRYSFDQQKISNFRIVVEMRLQFLPAAKYADCRVNSS